MRLHPTLKGAIGCKNVSPPVYVDAVTYDQSTLVTRCPGQECPTKPEVVGQCTTSCHMQCIREPRGEQGTFFPHGIEYFP